MLDQSDIKFLIGLLDQGTYTGLKTTLKVNEVLLKLQSMEEALPQAEETEKE